MAVPSAPERDSISMDERPMGIVIVDDQAQVAHSLHSALNKALERAPRPDLPPVEVHMVVNPGQDLSYQEDLERLNAHFETPDRLHAISPEDSCDDDIVRHVIYRLIERFRGCLVISDMAMPIPGPDLLEGLLYHVTTFDKARGARGIPDGKALWAYHSTQPPFVSDESFRSGHYAFSLVKPILKVTDVSDSLVRLMVPALAPEAHLDPWGPHGLFVKTLNDRRTITLLGLPCF